MITDELQALVLADAIGALDDDERRALERQVSALSVEDQQAVGRLYDTVLTVAESADGEQPPASARGRLLDAIRKPSYYTVTAGDAWDDSGVPGIRAKVLAVDRSRGLVTLLLRGEAGARYPSHHHSTPEECYVVRGSISIGDLVLRAGDFHHADADSDHGEIVALESSEVLLVAGIDDYLPA